MLSLTKGTEVAKVLREKKVIETVYLNDELGDDDDDERVGGRYMKFKDKLVLTPPTKHFSLAVFGPSGVGKSFYINQFLLQIRKRNKDRPIYVFSPVNDGDFEKVKPIYIRIDDSLLSDPLKIIEFANGVAVFDDIESLGKKLYTAISHFRDVCLETGRHQNIDIISVSHIIQGNNQTKRIINESDISVVFPRSNFNAISKLCRNYYGMSKEDLEYVKAQGKTSRAVIIKRSFPSFILSDHSIKLF